MSSALPELIDRKGLAALMGWELLYFVRAESGFVKIGRTRDLDARLRTLRSGSPVPLHLVLVLAGDSEIEAAWHRHFAQYRRHGEWFDLPEGWEVDFSHVPSSCWAAA